MLMIRAIVEYFSRLDLEKRNINLVLIFNERLRINCKMFNEKYIVA
ncbi:hypothetical protein J4526_03850 [Desulfurococcaceae archaeon MEX13E-LK6-19]|nr:hypothetical protein J4526_03850 [Desulfurococcaceae archaeon MEX13E-LK6-19]